MAGNCTCPTCRRHELADLNIAAAQSVSAVVRCVVKAVRDA